MKNAENQKDTIIAETAAELASGMAEVAGSVEIEGATLNDLEKKVYEVIYDFSSRGKWASQKDIVDAVNADEKIGERLPYNDGDYNHCRRIWTIVNRINGSGAVDRIIVSRDYAYKLGTAEECRAYFKKQRNDALKKLVRLSILEDRYRRNGQGRISGGFVESVMPEGAE